MGAGDGPGDGQPEEGQRAGGMEGQAGTKGVMRRISWARFVGADVWMWSMDGWTMGYGDEEKRREGEGRGGRG